MASLLYSLWEAPAGQMVSALDSKVIVLSVLLGKTRYFQSASSPDVQNVDDFYEGGLDRDTPNYTTHVSISKSDLAFLMDVLIVGLSEESS